MIRQRKLLFCWLLLIGLGLSAQQAIIVETRGKVESKKSDIKEWHPAKVGELLSSDDMVRTFNNGYAVLVFSDNTRLDVSRNSNILITNKASRTSRSKPFKGLWAALKAKFSETKVTKASIGGVGVLRGKDPDHPLKNMKIEASLQVEMKLKLAEINSQKLDHISQSLLRGILYETYEQHVSAEQEYLGIIATRPDLPIIYDLLIDLYLKLDFYEKANQILKKKGKISSQK